GRGENWEAEVVKGDVLGVHAAGADGARLRHVAGDLAADAAGVGAAGDLDRDRRAQGREEVLIVRREGDGGRAGVEDAEGGARFVAVGLHGGDLIAELIEHGVERHRHRAGRRQSVLQLFQKKACGGFVCAHRGNLRGACAVGYQCAARASTKFTTYRAAGAAAAPKSLRISSNTSRTCSKPLRSRKWVPRPWLLAPRM